MNEEIIETVCPRDCYDSCFLRVRVNKQKMVTIKGDSTNPVTRGFICPRGVKDGERLYLNRIFHPYIRAEGPGMRDLRRTEWNTALTLVANKINEVLNDYGPEAILHLNYAGNGGLLTWFYPQRIWNALGATKTDYALCAKSGHEALSLHYGSSYGIQPEQLLNQKMIIYWGFNAAVSSIHQWNLSQKARRKGALIAVIDSRRSKSAEKADLWLNPRPGSDVALAFGIARYIIEQGHVDLDFIEKWTDGYELLKHHILKWTPSRVKAATGVEWSDIEELGEAYGRLKPSATMIGIGFQKSAQGAESVRAVAFLPALLGLHRGFFYSNDNNYFVDYKYLTGEKSTNRSPKTVSQVALSNYIKQGDFKFIYIHNMNPTLTLPNQQAFREGLSRDDVFVVIHETHWTETTDYADIILPAPTYLEKDDLVIPWSHRHVRIARGAIEPISNCKDEVWVMQQIARKLDIDDDWLFEDPWESLKKALENSFENGTFEDLIKGKTLQLRTKPLNEYQTPTGKIEFCSKKAEELGMTPLPVYQPLEVSDGEFILLNSSLPEFTHTQFREVYGSIPEVVRINPDDARLLRITDGEVVILQNTHGAVTVKTEVSSTQPKGVLWSPKLLIGLNGEPQNVLSSCTPQKIGGGSVFNSTIVSIAKQEIND